MRKMKSILLGLTLSLLALSYIAVERVSNAQQPPPNLTCQSISCPSLANCGEAGTVTGCTLNCKTPGTSVTCKSGDDLELE